MQELFKTGAVSPIRYFGVAALVLGVLFALLNPEGTTDQGFFLALLQWVVQAAVPMALGIGAHRLLHLSRRFDQANPWLKLAVSGVVAALAFAPLSFAIDVVVGADEGPWGWAELMDEVGGVVLPVTFAWVAINAPFVLGYRWEREALREPIAGPASDPIGAAPPTPQPATDPFFLSLVPADRRGEVISLKAELHYLTVVTTRGRSMILYALGDAIGELPPDAGIQTHRSYWASVKHCGDLVRKGRGAELTLSDGSCVPVSRNRLSEVKAALKRG
jgi:hypothetical protein